MNDLAERTDIVTMAWCRFLLTVGQSLPRGETPETMGEFVEAHRLGLHEMKQRRGKGQLVLKIQDLGQKWPLLSGTSAVVQAPAPKAASFDATSARQEPLMQEAKRIFKGTWLDEQGNPIPDKVEPEKESYFNKRENNVEIM